MQSSAPQPTIVRDRWQAKDMHLSLRIAVQLAHHICERLPSFEAKESGKVVGYYENLPWSQPYSSAYWSNTALG
jgi:hypothetical protein